jgi:hypothetical protein
VVHGHSSQQHHGATVPAPDARGALTEVSQPDSVTTDLVEYLLIVFPDRPSLGAVVAPVRELVSSERIRVLDIVVVDRDADGLLEILELGDVDALAPLADLDGDLGLLSENDIQLAARTVLAGEAALVLVAEDRWAERLSVAARHAGGRVVAGERIPAPRVEAALADPFLTDDGGA